MLTFCPVRPDIKNGQMDQLAYKRLNSFSRFEHEKRPSGSRVFTELV